MGRDCRYHSTFRDTQNRPYELEQQVEGTSIHAQEIDLRSRETGDADSSHCSIASSRSYSGIDMCFDKRSHSQTATGSPVSDAQSFDECAYGRHDDSSSEEEIAAEVHAIELYAYYSVLRVLYVSGPLSWEQEVLLTNLRLSLHVSNDEHLLEIRRLCSTQAM